MNLKSRSIMWLIAVFVVTHLTSNDANARVLYFKVWRSVYGESGKKTGCSLCHPGKEKRVLNDYGKKLFKELDERDVRDTDRIERAIRKIGKPGNATQNKELPASNLNSRPQVPDSNDIHPRAVVSQYVDLLPTDSESLLVINQNYRIRVSIDDVTPHESLTEFFLSGLLSCCARQNISGSEVLLCVAGSRRFRSRDDLGLISFEGAQLIVFHDGERAVDQIKNAISQSNRSELANGFRLATFDTEVSQTGASSVHVAALSRNVIVSANNKGFLLEVLSRASQKDRKTVAFPESLIEWNGVPTQSGIWGLRHYKQRTEEFTGDPTSPFQMLSPRLISEAHPIGFGVSLDYKQGEASINYWSHGSKSAQVARQLWAVGLPKDDVELTRPSPGRTTLKIQLPGKVAAPEDSSFLITMLMMLGYGLAV